MGLIHSQDIPVIDKKHIKQVLLSVLDTPSVPSGWGYIFYQTKLSDVDSSSSLWGILDLSLNDDVVQLTDGEVLALEMDQICFWIPVQVCYL